MVQTLCNGQTWNRYDQLLEDIRTLLQGLLFHTIQYVSRESNKVAHALAQMAARQSMDYACVD
jgi:virulence-associated protein VapD